MDVDVLYYDPAWQVMWAHDGQTSDYVTTTRTFAFKAGDRVRLSGVTGPPYSEFSLAAVDVEILGPANRQPVRIDPAAIRHEDWLDEFVTLRGLVDEQGFDDESHLALRLAAGGHAVNVWLMVDPAASIPRLTGAFIDVSGVYIPRFNPSGELAGLEIFSPGLDHLTQVGWLSEDERFEQPVQSIDQLDNISAADQAHVRGRLVGHGPDGVLLVRDATGQIEAHTGQRTVFPVGETVELVGYPSTQGVLTRLNRALVRPAGQDTLVPRGEALLLHRLAAAVMEMSPGEAARGDEVMLNGIVTWSSPYSPYLFVHDASGGIRVRRPDPRAAVPPVGSRVTVHGHAALGDFAPVVIADSITLLDVGELPPAKAITLEHALTGIEEAQRVELSGYVREVRRDGYWTRLELSTTAGVFVARIEQRPELTGLVGSVVSVRGVCTAIADAERKLTGIELWLPPNSQPRIEEQVPTDPFSLTRIPVAELGRFTTAQNLRRRVKVGGTVLLSMPTGVIYLDDGGETLRLLSRRDGADLQPGDQIEAVGIFGRDGSRSVLREAVYQKRDEGENSPAQALTNPATLNPELDGRRVALTGRVVELSLALDRPRLTLQSERELYDALLQFALPESLLHDLRIGSELQLNGIYEVVYNELTEPVGFDLLVAQPDDLTVLRQPSWLTRGRVLAISGTLLVGVTLSLLWIGTLRRRISFQSIQIQHQLERESHLEAELHRASRLDSMGGLAGGIARDFNRLIGVISRDLNATRTRAGESSQLREAIAATEQARELARKLLNLSKNNAPARALLDPANMVRTVAAQVIGEGLTQCEFEFADDLWPVDADRELLSQVIANVTTNAMESMNGRGHIRFTLHNETVDADSTVLLPPGPYVRLAVIDQGKGIPANLLPRIFDPYFTTRAPQEGLGLSTAYAIVRKHGGHITAESTPMIGTTVRIWLPTSAGPAAPPTDDT